MTMKMKTVLIIILLISILLSSFTFTAFAQEEIVITAADELCKMEGNSYDVPVYAVIDEIAFLKSVILCCLPRIFVI